MQKTLPSCRRIACLLALLSFVTTLHAQTGTLQVSVTDGKSPLAGASIQISPINRGGYTNANGRYSTELNAGSYEVSASFVGYTLLSRSVTITAGQTSSLEFALEAGTTLNTLVVLGSRSLPRTQTATPVPVDVIDIKRIISDAPQVSVNQLLNYIAPSFSSGTQTVADGTDHIDPASLRGLGPDQVLVLINGKRRHDGSDILVPDPQGRSSGIMEDSCLRGLN